MKTCAPEVPNISHATDDDELCYRAAAARKPNHTTTSRNKQISLQLFGFCGRHAGADGRRPDDATVPPSLPPPSATAICFRPHALEIACGDARVCAATLAPSEQIAIAKLCIILYGI